MITKNKNNYIFLADGYKGGSNTFLYHHMQYLIKKKRNVYLIDKKPNVTFSKLHKKINAYKIDVFNDKNKKENLIKKILESNYKYKNYIIFTNFFIYIKYFFFFRKLKNKNNKIILTIHSGILVMSLRRLLAGIIFSLIYKQIDYLIFGSNSAKLWWKTRFPWMKIDKLLVHHNGVKVLKNLKAKTIKKNFQISFVGRLAIENNPHFFIRIAQEYLKKDKNVIFNIFGSGIMLEKLKLNYSSKNIKFHGWIEEKKIYKMTDLVIITAPINNYPYVALEAKSYGIPVIACSEGDIKKIIYHGKDGFLSPNKSEKVIVRLIKKVKNNYRRFSFNSLKKSKNFNLKETCDKFWSSIVD